MSQITAQSCFHMSLLVRPLVFPSTPLRGRQRTEERKSSDEERGGEGERAPSSSRRNAARARARTPSVLLSCNKDGEEAGCKERTRGRSEALARQSDFCALCQNILSIASSGENLINKTVLVNEPSGGKFYKHRFMVKSTR